MKKSIIKSTTISLAIASILLFFFNYWRIVQLNLISSSMRSYSVANCDCSKEINELCTQFTKRYPIKEISLSNIKIIIVMTIAGIVLGILVHFFKKKNNSKKNKFNYISLFLAISCIVLLFMSIFNYSTYNEKNYNLINCQEITRSDTINNTLDLSKDSRVKMFNTYSIPFPIGLGIGIIYTIIKSKDKKKRS